MKRYLAALAIGGAVFGTVLASAADLGTVTDGTLGSASGVVQTCQATNTISADYRVSWDTVSERYEVTDVELNGLTTACNGKRVKVALLDSGSANVADSADNVLVAHDGTGAGGTSGKQLIPVTGDTDNATALEVTGIRVTIFGE